MIFVVPPAIQHTPYAAAHAKHGTLQMQPARRNPMIEQSWANEFAAEWIAAWNSHDTIGILYRSLGRRRVIELLTFNEGREVIRGSGLYGGPA
jgi:hypothetical protein